MTGFRVLATLLIRGKSTISGEAILYALVPNSSKKSTAVSSKGDEKMDIPIFFDQL